MVFRLSFKKGKKGWILRVKVKTSLLKIIRFVFH
nr:MAG TPA: hypothetical protein [Caudoviricetes sp.]DAP14288.1 MAG TPA: hypothetical protein [Caudoviricetes sp.]